MPSKKRTADGDVDPRPAKVARHSPDWPDPLPPSDTTPATSSATSNIPVQPPAAPDDPMSPDDSPTVSTPTPDPPPSAADTPPSSYSDVVFPSYIDDDDVKTRLLDLLRFIDDDKARYNVGLFPDHTRWGVNNGRSTTFDRYLCTSDKPGVIRLIGAVRFLQTKNDRVNVGIEPLSPFDSTRAKEIQNGKARPSRSPSKSNLVYASKFLNGNVFEEAYDATDVLLPWTDMQDFKLPFRRIRATDVVLLECLIRRYPPPNAPYGSSWEKFSIAFELTHIARLVVGPGIPDYLPD